MHEGGEPSAWVRRFAGLIPAGGQVLDLACGSGRHLRWLAAHSGGSGRGWRLVGVDRDAAALAPLADIAETLAADLESGPWPLGERRFEGIVITNYLWRPLAPAVLAALAAGGVLIHETFADGQQTIGRPSRPEFLLQPGELLRLYPGLRVVAFEDGFEPARGAAGSARFVQRIAAVRERAGSAPGRHALDG